MGKSIFVWKCKPAPVDRCTSIEVLFDILQLSDRFDTGDIHDKAQQCIANFRITAENSLDVLKVLNYYRHLLNFSGVCEGLGRRCAEIINADFRSVREDATKYCDRASRGKGVKGHTTKE